jgi:hypothetical protein
MGRAPSLGVIPLHLIYDILVAVVQYTFTHKQYTEQHCEVEYTERNILNNKNALLGYICVCWPSDALEIIQNLNSLSVCSLY